MTAAGQPIGIAVVLSHDATRCLVGIRDAGAPLAGMLEFPGGRCLPDESPRETAFRECFEETGIPVEPLWQIEQRSHDYDHGLVELHFWLCQPRDDVEPSPSEPFAWHPVNELDATQFPEANTDLISRLVAAGSLEELTTGDQTESTHDS